MSSMKLSTRSSTAERRKGCLNFRDPPIRADFFVHENANSFCLILWEHEPVKSSELVALCRE